MPEVALSLRAGQRDFLEAESIMPARVVWGLMTGRRDAVSRLAGSRQVGGIESIT
ncbi:hypothetical protein AB0J20_23875 [Micromonospora costi]|uniref:hypothetical protein n=1 Tax=Micromonospora costi TaxID=1530042 RepID=UPI0033CA51FC